MILTDSQKQAFESRGIIYLKNALSANKVAQVLEFSKQQLEDEGVQKEGNWVSKHHASSEENLVAKSLLNRYKKRQILVELIAETEPLISELVDHRPIFQAAKYSQPLITFPNTDAWTVPYKSWHLDCNRLSTGGIPGVQVFTFLESVVHGGAGTLAVMGSHRLLNDHGLLRSKDVINQLKLESYFRDLMHKNTKDRHRFMREVGHVGDVELQLIEMVGEPGDIYLMDMRVVHAASSNASSIPRMMLTQRFFLESARTEIYGTDN